jgi:hypothetical protein
MTPETAAAELRDFLKRCHEAGIVVNCDPQGGSHSYDLVDPHLDLAVNPTVTVKQIDDQRTWVVVNA